MLRSLTKVLALLILLLASMNLKREFYQMHQDSVRRQETYEQGFGYVCYLGPSADALMRVYIEPFVIILFVGSCLKRLKGTLLSVAGLAEVVFFYSMWWGIYFRVARITESERELQSIRHVAYLYNANYLDICIAALIALLIVLHVQWALRSLFRWKTTNS